MGDSRQRFATLDAMRGVAAIGVMLWHTPGNQGLPGGYLMVDLFFAISGFVMALNYEDRLRRGMPVRHFLALRVARLWPMIVIGTLPCVLLLNAWIGMAFLLPEIRTPSLYPSNPAYWSLLMEACAYVAFALSAPRLSASGVAVVALISGLALSMAVVGHPLLFEFGSFWHTVPHGLARVAFSFSIGVLVYRIRAAQGLPWVESGRAWILPAALLPIMMLVPAHGQLQGLLVILVALPLLLWLATKWDVPHLRFATGLSALSYPLYCLHMPGLWIGDRLGMPTVATWVGLIGFSLALDRWADRPMRRKLRAAVERRWQFTPVPASPHFGSPAQNS